jgi:hypothetical protein
MDEGHPSTIVIQSGAVWQYGNIDAEFNTALQSFLTWFVLRSTLSSKFEQPFHVERLCNPN